MSDVTTRAPGLRAKGLYAKKSLVVQYALMSVGFGAIVLFGMMGAAGSPGTGLLPLIATAGMAFWYTSKPVVQAYGQHVEIKAAPLAGKRLVAYDQIVRLEQDSPKKARLTFRDGEAVRTVKLPLRLLSSEDGTKLVGFLRSRMPGGRRAA